jgi:3'-phosphoadenosine 5'-phosphosulfate sulfotransferase (PAPS reductase)/FAD synthetase
MNPFLINEPTCISFSGGRTSAYMLYRILEAHQMSLPEEAIVCFANTGKEAEETIKFVKAIEDNWGVEIHWLEYQNAEPSFKRVNFETASRNGEPFESLIHKKGYLPNPMSRYCSIEMKIRVIHKYLKSLGWSDHSERCDWVGIRADEQRRSSKIEKHRTPLVSAGVTKEIVGEFWRNSSFDLELPNNNGVTMHGNCDLCFLKHHSKILSLVNEKPERAIWWAGQEAWVESNGNPHGDGDKFRKDRPSYKEYLSFSKSQKDMFPIGEDIACFCGD